VELGGKARLVTADVKFQLDDAAFFLLQEGVTTFYVGER
jgi:hypothetical protein